MAGVRACVVCLLLLCSSASAWCASYTYHLSVSAPCGLCSTYLVVSERTCAAVAKEYLRAWGALVDAYAGAGYAPYGSSCQSEAPGTVDTVWTFDVASQSLATGALAWSVATVYLSLDVDDVREPALSRRVSDYPVGEVVVYCAALLLFALGIKVGS